MSLAWACNTAWMLAGLGERRAFLRATRQVADEQGRLLDDILDRILLRGRITRQHDALAHVRNHAVAFFFLSLRFLHPLLEGEGRLTACEACCETGWGDC